MNFSGYVQCLYIIDMKLQELNRKYFNKRKKTEI